MISTDRIEAAAAIAKEKRDYGLSDTHGEFGFTLNEWAELLSQHAMLRKYWWAGWVVGSAVTSLVWMALS